jgi:hypothetical protein
MRAATKERVFPRRPNDYVALRRATLKRGHAGIGPRHEFRRQGLLNRFNRPPPMAGEAEVRYLDGDFRIVRPGAFVRCAVSGIPIPLEELKYWNVDLQEAYASPEAVLQRHRPYPDKPKA